MWSCSPSETTKLSSATDEAPVATPEAVETTNETAEEIAQGFVEAYGAFDADRAITYLADDADIIGLIDGFTTEEVQGTLDELDCSARCSKP